ncbi:MAG: divergent polysaccharide deacetylase family protein [Alphaproteobacteria bacterium]|nr:divergent polysaccharide deacetylase family protein [Alphaproteobacteria bacterium]
MSIGSVAALLGLLVLGLIGGGLASQLFQIQSQQETSSTASAGRILVPGGPIIRLPVPPPTPAPEPVLTEQASPSQTDAPAEPASEVASAPESDQVLPEPVADVSASAEPPEAEPVQEPTQTDMAEADPAPDPADRAEPDREDEETAEAPSIAQRPQVPEVPEAVRPSAPPPRFDEQMTLRPAPDPNLLEESDTGPLPIVGRDGREAWEVYARPSDDSLSYPRIAIVVTSLGLSSAATQLAIQRLPGTITLSFAPNARRFAKDVAAARAAGHEVLVNLPLEPESYPRSDPGPFTLLTTLNTAENIQRLQWVLSRGTGYVGVVNFMGARFTGSPTHLAPILQTLNDRGLLFVDSRPGRGSRVAEMAAELNMPFAVSNGFIDQMASRFSIDAALNELERIARETGIAVGLAQPYPVSIERLIAWAPSLTEKGLLLAPISAVARRQLAASQEQTASASSAQQSSANAEPVDPATGQGSEIGDRR